MRTVTITGELLPEGMDMKLRTIVAIAVAAGLTLAGCSGHNQASSADSTTTATATASAEATSDNSLAYYATYSLEAGTYRLSFGHTHEHFILMAFARTDDVTDFVGTGKKAINNPETTVEQETTITPDDASLYYIKMAHNNGWVDLTIPTAGQWTIFADLASGSALPWKLCTDAGEEIAPASATTLDNSANDIYNGYFEDSQVADRSLSDYEGQWQSVYPLLTDGSLDSVMEHKAEKGDKTAEQWKDYYDVGYRTDIENITISGDTMSFTRGGETATATYAYDRYEILTYAKGNRGVRFLFSKKSGDDAAPAYVQFSDHNIAPVKASHFHIYMGDTSQEDLLKEMDHWPTYYPASLSKEEIVEDMMGH